VVLDNLSSLAGFKSGDPDCWTELQRFLMLQRRRPCRAGRPPFQQGWRAARHQSPRGRARPGDGVAPPGRLGAEPRHALEIHFDKARGLQGEAIEPIEAHLQTDHLDVARWTWRPLRDTTFERLVALMQEGLNASQAGRELGLTNGTTYRLRTRRARSG